MKLRINKMKTENKMKALKATHDDCIADFNTAYESRRNAYAAILVASGVHDGSYVAASEAFHAASEVYHAANQAVNKARDACNAYEAED